MPKTYIFHSAKNPEIEVPIDLITTDDCKKMIGKTYYLIHKDYEPSGKPFRVVVDSVYPEDDCEVMTICVCHRAGKRRLGEEIEVGFECLFKSRFTLWLDKMKKKRFAKKMKKKNYACKNF